MKVSGRSGAGNKPELILAQHSSLLLNPTLSRQILYRFVEFLKN
jgi:hypothetical protein